MVAQLIHQKFDFDQKFGCLSKSSIFWQKVRFLAKVRCLSQGRFLTKSSMFDPKFDFWPKVRFLTQSSIFEQNFVCLPIFCPKDKINGCTKGPAHLKKRRHFLNLNFDVVLACALLHSAKGRKEILTPRWQK